MSPNREILLCCRAFSDSWLTLIMNISQIVSIYINFPFLAIWYLQPIQWKGLKCLHSPQWFQTEVIVEAHSSMLIQKCSFCHFKWKSATEEVKWAITACWEQWLWLFHCSICLQWNWGCVTGLSRMLSQALSDRSGAVVKGVLVKLQKTFTEQRRPVSKVTVALEWL